MAQPDNNDVSFDPLLTNISIAVYQNPINYIMSKVFPVISVPKQSGKYAVYDQNSWFIDEAKPRGDSEESSGGGYTISKESYNCIPYAYHKDIGDQIRKNAASVFNLDSDATRFVTEKLMLRQENAFVDACFKTGVWGADKVGGTDFVKFSNQATSDPIGVISTYRQTMQLATGYDPNTIVMGYEVYENLKNHPDIVDRLKYTTSEPATEQVLAKLLGVENLYVAKAIKASNKEGDTAAYTSIFGDNALLCYVTKNPGLLVPTAGYTFVWDYAGIGPNIGISKMRIDTKKCDRIEGEIAFTPRIIAPGMGTFLSDCD